MPPAFPGLPEHKGLADRIKTLEAQVARLSRARTMQSTSLDGGTFRVKNGGTIQLVNDSGDVVAELDKDSQTFFDNSGNPLTVLDGNGLDIGSGLVVVDADGLQVGSDVVIDSTGLEVIGGMVTPVWPFTVADNWDDVTVTSDTQLGQVTIDPPDWVEQIDLLSVASGHFSNQASALRLFTLGLVNDDGGASENGVFRIMEAADGGGSGVGTIAITAANRETIPLSPTGRSVVVTVTGSVSIDSPTQGSNSGSLSIIGFGTRSA